MDKPSKKIGIEQGLSDAAISACSELQGPINWSSIDLRTKYREEKTRRDAHFASLVREKEAKRMEREQRIFIPIVAITDHPIHTDTKRISRYENSTAKKRGRARTNLRVFSKDIPTIWAANRPSKRLRRKLLKSEYPLGGLGGRRDPEAHEQQDAQVQSVTVQRALAGAISGIDDAMVSLNES